ncbi:high mobility group protein B4, putative (HMGB4) [Babesia microti strain RI]|uniref:High mobility group protein B4, putative (HMGB4) n=1 Tax=Babesia microti (strain RI) TaxID=1133968 RepID=A0A1R4AB03_BABMR|nr:high mobility group protein B4, putative (HMGB4) [Babesia microti strain RI]SJK86179.1 high mobility group protein B4, putative (HMGB4) [Babesia microti strain RI]|eukprot:XP_021338370.1 high mobility group protein B4, putative (HMGB4) [Babesia microti strain RI]
MDSNVGAIGYRLFCNEQIPAIKQRIELETGRKAKVSDLQKELSTLWKNLTEQERQVIDHFYIYL